MIPLTVEVQDCWNKIGIAGDRSCPELTKHIVCQNCPVFASAARTSARGSGETFRAVRPYVPGDPARLVHWPTSARRGELVVREYEPPPALGVALVVDLSGSAPETAATHAMSVGTATLAAGGVVWLCTVEAGGPVSDAVVDARALGRRLARAIAGAPPEPPPGWTPEVVRA